MKAQLRTTAKRMRNMSDMLGFVDILFYFFSAALLSCSSVVVFSKRPINAVMSLIISFILAACLWILNYAEFLGLLLIFVYVGAVMTLFLFIVMMINLNTFPARKHLHLGLFITLLAAVSVAYHIHETFDLLALNGTDANIINNSNVSQLGSILYTTLSIDFHICGLLLLTAAIGGVSLCHLSQKTSTTVKRQNISNQINASSENRVELIDLRQDEN